LRSNEENESPNGALRERVAFCNAVTGCVDRGSSDGPTNLGDEGLTVGDTIDPYLDEHFRNDQHVIIPAGSTSSKTLAY